jgi:hypothetical protein
MVGLQREEEAPRSSSWSSQEEDHGQCLEAKLLAGEKVMENRDLIVSSVV